MYLDILEQTKGTLKIIFYLNQNIDKNPEISRIIDDLGIPRQSCYTALKNLEDAGLIASNREKGRPPKVYCKLTQKGLTIAQDLRDIDTALGTTIEGYNRQLGELKQKDLSKAEYEKERLSILRMLERECNTVGKWDDAIKHGQEIASLCRRSRNHEGQAEALRRIGRIYTRRTEFNKALNYFQRSLGIARAIKDHKGLASDCYERGNIFENKGQFSKALEMFNQSEEYADISGAEIEKAEAYLGIGRIYAFQGLYEDSVKTFKKALNIFEKYNEVNKVLKTYTSLGASEYYINLDEAIKWHEKCMELSEKEGNTRMLGYSLSNAAGCYIKKNDFNTAKKYLDRALPIFEQLKEKAMILDVFVHYAHIYRLKEQWREAKHYLSESMRIARAIKEPQKIAYISLHYGLLHKDRGNWKKAKRYLMSAKKSSIALGMKDLVTKANKELKGITQ